jgi:hypothetical protein
MIGQSGRKVKDGPIDCIQQFIDQRGLCHGQTDGHALPSTQRRSVAKVLAGAANLASAWSCF